MQFQIALSGLFIALVAELILEQGPEFAKGFEVQQEREAEVGRDADRDLQAEAQPRGGRKPHGDRLHTRLHHRRDQRDG